MGDETEEQKKANEAINAAVTAHVGRKLPRLLEEALAPAVAAALKPFQEQLAQLAAGMGTAQGQGHGGNQQAAGAAGTTNAAQGQGQAAPTGQPPLDQATQKRLADLERQLKDSQERAKASEDAARAEKRDALLMEHLGKANVDPARRRGAAALLKDCLVHDAVSNTWKYRAQRDGYTDDLDVAAGIKEWVATDEGKAYVTAQPRTGGAGTRPTSQANQGGGARTPGQVQGANKSQAQADALAALRDGVEIILGTGSISIT